MAQNRTNVPLLTFLWGVSSGSERLSRVVIGCPREGALSAFGALLSVRAEVAMVWCRGALYHPLTSASVGNDRSAVSPVLGPCVGQSTSMLCAHRAGVVGRSRLGSATRVDAVSDHCAGVAG